MFNSSQLTRSVVIAATVISLGASPAMARPLDEPARPEAAVTTTVDQTRHFTRQCVDGTAVRPADRPVASAVPLTRAAHASGGADWLLIAIVASSLLALLTIVAVVRPGRHRADSLRARQV